MDHRRVAAVALLVVSLSAGTATAFHGATGSPPGPEDLGVDENDVRDEPSHPDDGNGFEDVAPYFSPKDDRLVLEAFVAPGTGYHHQTSVDVRNLLNVALHGENTDEYERTMYPGVNRYAAYWGWWSDTGGGGQLQSHDGASTAPGVGEADGAIDNAHDCKQRPWDEFTHRGDHPCPATTGHPAYPEDQMFAFVQPGTHDIHYNTFWATALSTHADEATQPDFAYRNHDLRWEEVPRPADLEYDSSALVTTKVVSAVNPAEVETGSDDTAYDPYTPDPDLADPDRDHAVDVDVYTAPHPLVEQAYRTAVWDPGDQVASPADALHPEGLKGWAKYDLVSTAEETQQDAEEAVSEALHPTERQRGVAQDLVAGPFFQEPNTPADQYGFDTTGSTADWATHDPATTYGGLDGDYFEPGPGQAHQGYADGEHLWVDTRVTMHSVPVPHSRDGAGTQLTPEAPDPQDPVAGVAREGGDNSKGPGFLSFDAYPGTWYDANGDGWVGDAGADGHPYDNGTTDDPHDYASDELRGTCRVDMGTTLHPTKDTDGDGTNDWGAAGVYVVEGWGMTYGNPWMDAVGRDADPVLDPLRNQDGLAGQAANYLFPERERLEQYRRTGPIDLDTWGCAALDNRDWAFGTFTVILPTGTLDFGFEAVTQATLADELRVSQHGSNQGDSLTGEAVRDVDRYDPVVEAGP